jgi:hypothetical protein
MMNRFIFITEEAGKVIHISPFIKIIPSYQLIIRDQPEEKINPRWDNQFPDRGDVNWGNTPEVDHTIIDCEE